MDPSHDKLSPIYETTTASKQYKRTFFRMIKIISWHVILDPSLSGLITSISQSVLREPVVQPFSRGSAVSSTSPPVLYLEDPWLFFCFFLRLLLAKGSILSTKVPDDDILMLLDGRGRSLQTNLFTFHYLTSASTPISLSS